MNIPLCHPPTYPVTSPPGCSPRDFDDRIRQSPKPELAAMKLRIGSEATGQLPDLALATLLLVRIAIADPINSGQLHGHPGNSAAASSQITHTTKLTSQANILGARRQLGTIGARQVSCPDPSTDSLCESGFCFLAQNSADPAWATCCPAGWYLQLDSAEWSTQKCVSNGVSQAPLRPLSCGSGGVFSGWACVYYQNPNGGEKARWPTLLALGLGMAWIVAWIHG